MLFRPILQVEASIDNVQSKWTIFVGWHERSDVYSLAADGAALGPATPSGRAAALPDRTVRGGYVRCASRAG